MKFGVVVVALLAPVGLAAAACGFATAGTSSNQQALPVPLRTLEAAPPTYTNPFVDEVDALGSSRFGDIYGGFWPARTGTAHFGVVEPGTQVRARAFIADIAQFEAELKGRCTALAQRAHQRTQGCSDVVTPVSHTYRSLRALTLRVRETPALRKVAVTLAEWGPDPRSNTVLVRVRGSERAARRILDRRFGSGWITVKPWRGGLPVAGPATSTPAIPPNG